MLDAGTGPQSIRWIEGLPTASWTAVSAAPGHVDQLHEALTAAPRAQDRIIIGNWINNNLLKDEIFDTVIADYLLGAVEGFSPYFQSHLLRRLRQLTGKTLYLTGLEPYVPTNRPDNKDGQLLWEIGRFRDACVLLGGDFPYREYPAHWVVDQLKIANFSIREVKHFKTRFKSQFVNAQINLCKPSLDALEDQDLAEALKSRGEALRSEALAHVKTEGAISYGSNYVIAAEPG